jgi:hypothetical protein
MSAATAASKLLGRPILPGAKRRPKAKPTDAPVRGNQKPEVQF